MTKTKLARGSTHGADLAVRAHAASSLETMFSTYLAFLAPDLAARVVEQYAFAPGRRYRLDFAFVDEKVGIELQGGLRSGGAHARPDGILRDYDKSNLATASGWRVLHYATSHIEDDPESVIAQIRTVLERTAR